MTYAVGAVGRSGNRSGNRSGVFVVFQVKRRKLLSDKGKSNRSV